MDILKVVNVSKTYGSGEAKVEALKRVSFSLEKGAFAATMSDKSGRILIIEVAAACLLAIGIFLTNVFMPNSAINSFITGLTTEEITEAAYSEFDLYPVVSELSDAEVSVEIAHTSVFRSVISGLTDSSVSAGDNVEGNIPVGWSDGSSQVSVSMYNEGVLLDCYTLSGTLPVWNTTGTEQ